MPRFFFDFLEADERIPDHEGMEFADVEQAYLEAFHGAQEMWAALLKQRRDPRRCRFEVRDGDRNLLFILPFQEVLDCCRDRAPVMLHKTLDQVCATANYAKRVKDELHDEFASMRATLKQSRALLLEKV